MKTKLSILLILSAMQSLISIGQTFKPFDPDNPGSSYRNTTLITRNRLKLDSAFVYLSRALHPDSSLRKSIVTPNQETKNRLYNGFDRHRVSVTTPSDILEAYRNDTISIGVSDDSDPDFSATQVNYKLSKMYKEKGKLDIVFFQSALDSLTAFGISKLILYTMLKKNVDSLIADIPNKEIDVLAKNICDLYNNDFNTLYPNATQWIYLELEKEDVLVTHRILDSTILNDVSTIISGTEGKIKASKVDVKFIAPGIDISLPIFAPNNNKTSLQIGGGINFKEPISEILNKKPNFDLNLDLEVNHINTNKYKFDKESKTNFLHNLYKIPYANMVSRDSMMLNAPWSSKKLRFFTGKLDLKMQRLNILDSTVSSMESDGQKSKFNISGSFNFHYYHYVESKNSFFNLKNGGNKYLKFGLDAALNNNVANENAQGVKVQEIDSSSNNKLNKVANEFIAYVKEDVMQTNFTLNPHMDAYFMENSRRFGLHFQGDYKLVFKDKNTYDNLLKLGIGLFGSIQNSNSKNGKSPVNFELILTSVNPISDKLRFSSFYKSMVPVLKLEFPFNQIHK